MKKNILILILLLCIISLIFILYLLKNNSSIVSPVGKDAPKERPLLSYTFENLEKTKFAKSEITLGAIVNKSSDFYSQMFYFSAPKTPGSTPTLKASGLINIPQKPGNYPVIVMFRGYVPRETYKSGIGSQPSAQVFAKNGFITLSPDFLGYAESASPSADSFEERFQTYTTALTLLSSLTNLNTGLDASYSGSITADLAKIGIWGHSNGGHIVLSVLAISGVTYPTVLWAPVSQGFPYSILYYTDEYDDGGKALRKSLSRFEEDYDTNLFSPSKYYSWIKAPIEIDQGLDDHEVLPWWSLDLAATLKKNSTNVTYLTYPNADHNLLPGGWTSAVENSVTFYKDHFSQK